MLNTILSLFRRRTNSASTSKAVTVIHVPQAVIENSSVPIHQVNLKKASIAKLTPKGVILGPKKVTYPGSGTVFKIISLEQGYQGLRFFKLQRRGHRNAPIVVRKLSEFAMAN